MSRRLIADIMLLCATPHGTELVRRASRYAIAHPRDFARLRAVSRAWRRNTRYHASVFREAAMAILLRWTVWRSPRLHLPTAQKLLLKRIAWLRYEAPLRAPLRGALIECTSRVIRASEYMHAAGPCWRARCEALCKEMRSLRRHRLLCHAEHWVVGWVRSYYPRRTESPWDA